MAGNSLARFGSLGGTSGHAAASEGSPSAAGDSSQGSETHATGRPSDRRVEDSCRPNCRWFQPGYVLA